MILISLILNVVIAIIMLVVFSILMVVFFIGIKKEKKRYSKAKALSINDIVRIEKLNKFIKYNIKRKDSEIGFSLLMISIDQFDQIGKYINQQSLSTFLKKVASNIRMNLPKGAKMAQTKEREIFLVYLPQKYNEEEFINIAKRFKNSAERKVLIRETLEIQKTVSVALITFPDYGNSLENLINHLKTTIYYIKRHNGNTIAMYNSDLKQSYPERYDILKNAIKNNDIKTYYYPIYDLINKDIYGTEIIVNWEKNQNEIQTFRDLLFYSEISNDEYWLGIWFFEQMLEDHASVFRLMVNKEYYSIMPASIRQFEEDSIVSLFEKITQKYVIDPRRIIIQIINPIEVNSSVKLMKNILELQNLGFKFCVEINKIDDRIMMILNEYQVSAVKINKDLLSPNVKGVEDLLKYLKKNNISIIATNVEKPDEINKRFIDEISFAQGIFDGFPCTKDELLTEVTKHRRSL